MRWPVHLVYILVSILPSFTAESMECTLRDRIVALGPDETCCSLNGLLPIKAVGRCPAPAFPAPLRPMPLSLLLGPLPPPPTKGRMHVRRIGCRETPLVISTTRDGEIVGDLVWGLDAQFRPPGAVKPPRVPGGRRRVAKGIVYCPGISSRFGQSSTCRESSL